MYSRCCVEAVGFDGVNPLSLHPQIGFAAMKGIVSPDLKGTQPCILNSSENTLWSCLCSLKPFMFSDFDGLSSISEKLVKKTDTIDVQGLT